ncbi:hypothetical protein MMC07_000546 [Pseudocyphellaria aurata]|nr:hypothetical protein [Pseudocyphellaria aurata]
MPLRAKILNPALQRQAMKVAALIKCILMTVSLTEAQMSTNQFDINEVKELPADDPNDVLFGSHFGARTIELNRPNKLNALNGSMARKIILRLKEWENSELASVIIIGGMGRKAFCAGGDVATIVQQNAAGPDGQAISKAYFALEYRLDQLIATYSKPYVAYMDGITMGGGVGLSVHAAFRIATENTVFAMPETSIGFFPDVGGSFFLPRLEGYIGTYLALTSNQLNGVNAFYTGIATHYIDSSSLPGLTARLGELEFKDYQSLQFRESVVNATIEEFVTGIPHDEPMLIAGEIRQAIDRCFRHDRVEDILAALEGETARKRKSRVGEWAAKTIETLHERSPISLKVTLRQMRLGKRWDISDAFQREYIMASRFMTQPDFAAGVSARLIKKPPEKPIWNPSTVSEVEGGYVDQFFLVAGEERLKLLGPDTYRDYPTQMALPTESDVKRAIADAIQAGRNGDRTVGRITSKILKDRGGKLGVTEKVKEVLERKCRLNDEGLLFWQDDISS